VVERPAAEALATEPSGHGRTLAETLRWLDERAGRRHILPLGDARYPASLLQTADPPTLLWIDGDAGLLAWPSIAIVGSRSPTPQGLDNARAFSAHLGRQGFAIVSGLALGIDGAAHTGALDAGAATLAVIGCGVDIVYPLRHRALAARIAAEGALVSELPLGTPALAAHFPQRNRIIAGLTRGTLVVEAALQSGSLITARLAAEANREVFAIPGSIHSPQSRGCHALIKQGAKLVDQASDILEELGNDLPSPTTAHSAAAAGAPVREKADPLLEALGFDPIGLDALVARTGESAGVLSARLLELELAGRVARLSGERFQRVERS
jgi:DNA processing protein